MRVRTKTIIATICLVAAALALAYLTRNREPEYQGRPLSYWTDFYMRGSGQGATDESIELADDAIRHIGSNAVPYLLKWWEVDRSWTRPPKYGNLPLPVRRMKFLTRMLASKYFRDVRRSGCAYLALNALGPEASTAIPELTRILNNTNSFNFSQQAAEILASIGKDAVPTLVAVATNRKSPLQTRLDIISALPDLGTNSYLAVPGLIQLISDPNPEIAGSAAAAIIEMGGRYITNTPAQ